MDGELDDFFGEESYISMTDRDWVKGVEIEGRLSAKEDGRVAVDVVVDTGAS